MATPSIGSLRHRISHQTALTTKNALGELIPGWRTVTSGIAAKIGPTKGGTDIRTARVVGLATYDIVIRDMSAAKAIKPGDQLKNDATGETYAVKWVGNLDERGRFRTATCTAGEVFNG